MMYWLGLLEEQAITTDTTSENEKFKISFKLAEISQY